ncbi:DsbA family protein [Methylicorpusculum oleiharenae]|uniref:DsbA family protein n=1 Tax=Methylicorpusculum oleiharenae TaxID=1338687 RepID=UPI002ED77FB7
MGLDHECFEADMKSSADNQALMQEIKLTQTLNVKGFPTLLLENGGLVTAIAHEYNNANNALLQIKQLSQ